MGVKWRRKSRQFKPCIPAVITGNVRSLANKMDEFEALLSRRTESPVSCVSQTQRVQRELKHSNRESKENYRRKLELKLENNNTMDVWRGMREITCFQRRGGGTAEGNE